MKLSVRISALTGLISILSIVALAAPPAGAPTTNDPEAWAELNQAAIARVKAGEVVIVGSGDATAGKGSQAIIKAAFIVNAPIQETWRILRETEKQYEYVASSDKNTLIVRTAEYDIVEFESAFLAWKFTYRVKHQWDNKKFQLWWNLDPSFKNDLSKVQGFWHLFYIDDTHTLIRYGTLLVAKDFVPSSVQQAISKRDLPNGLGDVRKRIESHGTYKRKGK